jgi:lipoprotein-anchoring transpeptidase ErfK/SrfK
MARSPNGKYGQVASPYGRRPVAGWIPLRGLHRAYTAISVRADLSRRQITVSRLGKVLFRVPAAVGAPSSPTPPGSYFVTDRVPTGNPNGPFGAYAFGLSGIQTHLPAGWHGGDQLAIHGTNDPATIGEADSAGCLRVSFAALKRLIPLLQLGTPVVIVR